MLVKSRYRHFSTYPVGVYTTHTHFFRPLVLSIRGWFVHFIHFRCVYSQLIYVSYPSCCVYTQLRYALCLYAGDKQVSTTAVSISSWFSPFIPISSVYTQLIRIYHHLRVYRQIIYTFAPCLFLRASEVCFYTLSVSVFSCTHFHVCYYIFYACSVSVQFMCTFPPFASKPTGCTPIFAHIFTIGYMHLFHALQHVTFGLLLCTQAHDDMFLLQCFWICTLYHFLSHFYHPPNRDQDIACLCSFFLKYVHASLLNKALISVTLMDFTGRSYDKETDTIQKVNVNITLYSSCSQEILLFLWNATFYHHVFDCPTQHLCSELD